MGRTEASPDMRRDFADRAELRTYLAEQFPEIVATGDDLAETVGGRKAAEERLAAIVPDDYGATRNYLTGRVTSLAPYVRHGVITIMEIRDAVVDRVAKPEIAEKLINELAWRDYFQRVYAEIGDGIWADREPYKTGFAAEEYAREVPDDLLEARTGLVCMDAFSRQLQETGYLHNHARMWMAAYLVHWRRVRWQAGAKWFLAHLLDGDPASNNLNWQWVASTFNWKPYIFNRLNLETYTGSVYCDACPLYGHCDFEGKYMENERRLFPRKRKNAVTGAAAETQDDTARVRGLGAAGPVPSGAER